MQTRPWIRNNLFCEWSRLYITLSVNHTKGTSVCTLIHNILKNFSSITREGIIAFLKQGSHFLLVKTGQVTFEKKQRVAQAETGEQNLTSEFTQRIFNARDSKQPPLLTLSLFSGNQMDGFQNS